MSDTPSNDTYLNDTASDSTASDSTEEAGTAFVCVDYDVPLALRTLTADHAIAVRADNDGSNLTATGDSHRFWGTGMVLRVRFLDGDDLASRVMAAAADWTQHANLEFRVVSSGPAEIRVTFLEPGNWSAVGTDALVPEVFPPDRPTMCLSEVPKAMSSTRVGRVVRHEFGHAIGLVHEHSSPVAGIHWDQPVVYAALARSPNFWTPAQVDHNVFRKYTSPSINHTAFDPASVMLYTFPPEWTTDRLSFAENPNLSPTDAAFVRAIYPGRA